MPEEKIDVSIWSTNIELGHYSAKATLNGVDALDIRLSARYLVINAVIDTLINLKHIETHNLIKEIADDRKAKEDQE